MEQSTPQGNAPSVHHSSVGQGAMPADYWNHLEPIYTNPDSQQSQQQPQQNQRQPPMGITWDHPIFSQSQQQAQHQQQPQPNLQAQQEHVQDYYSSAPQSWSRSSSLRPSTMSPGHGYGLSQQPQYQMPYPQDQVAYEARPQSPTDNLSYPPPYSVPNHYHQTTHVSAADPYSQPSYPHIAPRPPSTQQAQIRPNSAQQPLSHQYILPANYAENVQAPTSFSNNYLDPNSNVNYQNTINPQFLSAQPVDSQNQFLFYNPAASTYDRPNDPKNYQMYPDHLGAVNMNLLQTRNIQPQRLAPLQPLAPQTIHPGLQAPPGGATLARAASPKKKKPSSTKSRAKKAAKGMKSPDGQTSPDGNSDVGSSDESELEIEPPEEPSPLPPTRPSNPEGAAEYDAMEAVWSPRNRRPNVEKIKNALVAFKDVVKAVRDEWKTHSQAMKDAENRNETEKAAELKKNVILQRQLMDIVIKTTLDKGHPIIVEKLGEHPMAVAALYSFLLDRHQASDFDGVLTLNILKLLAQFTTMDEDVLQKTNVMKLLPRIIKKGGQPVKDLAQQILDNAAASTKRKQEASSTKGDSPGKDATPELANRMSHVEVAAPTKRPRESEGNGLPATKRSVTPSTIKGPVAATKPSSNAASAKRPEGAVDGKITTSTTAPATARPKANVVAPKPTSLFGSLSSASKKPGTSNAARAAAAAAAAKEKASVPVEKGTPPPPPPPPAKPVFSFGDILADLNKREESKVTKSTEDTPPESEEERQKRLHKEARRKLRVSWKPDDALIEVRLFTHDPDEEIGPNDGLKRDVGDIKGEGRMLKLHKDLDDEDDDEEMGIKEEELHPYVAPSEIDLEPLSKEDQERNFVKRGGTQKPDSPERLAQERREANTLMVFYTSPADVPPSPKEPPPPSEDEPVAQELAFGQPNDHVKAREARYLTVIAPQPPAQQSQPAVPTPTTMPTAPFDITNLLKVLEPGPQQAHSTPPPQPAQPAPLTELERTVNVFRQQQQQGQLPVQIPQTPQIPQVPQPSSQPIDFQKILAVLNVQKQVQQPPAFPQIPQSQPGIAPNLASIISQLTGNNGVTPQRSQQSAQNQSQAYEDPERKRFREMGAGRDDGYDDRYNKRPRMYVDPKAKKHPKAGSVPCKFWREGKCLKGEDCTFRHDPLD